MSKKKSFSPKFKSSLSKEKWNELCPPMEFRVLTAEKATEYGLFPKSIESPNCVVVGASGSSADTIMYFANLYRVDGSKMDQEPYFELYLSGSSEPHLHGIFHHSSFDNRTIELNENQLNSIAASGSSADINFTSKPNTDSGTLDELREQGKIAGFDFTWKEGMKKK